MNFKKNTHGGDIYDKKLRCDFSTNVNPLGTPESVRRAVIESAGKVHLYPDPCCRELIHRISEYEGISQENILCGNGAAELIYSFCTAVKPKTALELAPTFSEYSAALEVSGCTVERYELKKENGFALTEAFLGVLESKEWDTVFLCNPNNPTGRLIDSELLEEICRICAKKGMRLFLDECFMELSEDGGRGSMKTYLDKYPGLFILKAFTKNYAMAGLRLGYCLCADRNLLGRMSGTNQVWNVSVPAQEAGAVALEETEFLTQARELISRERNYLIAKLKSMGFYVCPSEANYILFHSSLPLYTEMLDRGIMIRSCADYHGLDCGWYRVAVKQREENDLLISELGEIMGG